MATQRPPSGCPIDSALRHLGDPWSLLIIRDAMFVGKRHYGEFLASPEGISTKVLAQRLKALVAEGILTKRPHPSNRVKTVYRLTRKGIDLLPIVVEMAAWSTRHVCGVDPDAGHMPEIRRDKRAFVEATRRRLEAEIEAEEGEEG